eukprot:5248441-Alexandrium_andersonii.AAC.1
MHRAGHYMLAWQEAKGSLPSRWAAKTSAGRGGQPAADPRRGASLPSDGGHGADDDFGILC